MIKVANNELTHTTHNPQRNMNLYTCLLSRLQRNIEITVLFCIRVIRDRTDQLDNKDMLKNLLKEINNVETILDSFRCSYCMYLSFENIQLFIVHGWI